MDRRTLLTAPLLAGAAAILGACAGEGPARGGRTEQGVGARDAERLVYGDDPSQVAELLRPGGVPRGVVVVVHGGFWRSAYDFSLGRPLALDLADRGWAALNLEYRRVGPPPGGGGGAPQTFDDVAAGIDLLAGLDLPLDTVVTLGHSAGGHLAAWAASRLRHERWAGGVPVTHVVSQAGVLDLRAATAQGLGSGAAEAFLGHAPTTADARYDPAQQLPLGVPVWCVHGTDDDVVPLAQSRDHVAAARAAGGVAELVEVPGDHMALVDVASPAWARTVEVLEGLTSG